MNSLETESSTGDSFLNYILSCSLTSFFVLCLPLTHFPVFPVFTNYIIVLDF